LRTRAAARTSHSNVRAVPELLAEGAARLAAAVSTGGPASNTEWAPVLGLPAKRSEFGTVPLKVAIGTKVVFVVETSVACGPVPLQSAVSATEALWDLVLHDMVLRDGIRHVVVVEIHTRH